ncbi:hypothetical protein BO78DRAFT_98111 [Aspergillus sclerotiicarbonarius CBS 121057]|uniref:Uncharacterized protein n=1 Tax=Aspergillus sclerotiicarbonarius (strain CBS 121057 / IBT 28362) TaxID=1448318 RepID=A0A319F6M8_ASPSB|nr:hypothetical protein BO78DRAFT_98111 [Aspergillus sclerotiicarbonarius CBS 121057]
MLQSRTPTRVQTCTVIHLARPGHGEKSNNEKGACTITTGRLLYCSDMTQPASSLSPFSFSGPPQPLPLIDSLGFPTASLQSIPRFARYFTRLIRSFLPSFLLFFIFNFSL